MSPVDKSSGYELDDVAAAAVVADGDGCADGGGGDEDRHIEEM